MTATVNGNVEQFNSQKARLNAEFEKIKDIVARFDEVLSSKVSKIALSDFQKQMREQVIVPLNDLAGAYKSTKVDVAIQG